MSLLIINFFCLVHLYKKNPLFPVEESGMNPEVKEHSIPCRINFLCSLGNRF